MADELAIEAKHGRDIPNAMMKKPSAALARFAAAGFAAHDKGREGLERPGDTRRAASFGHFCSRNVLRVTGVRLAVESEIPRYPQARTSLWMAKIALAQLRY